MTKLRQSARKLEKILIDLMNTDDIEIVIKPKLISGRLGFWVTINQGKTTRDGVDWIFLNALEEAYKAVKIDIE